MYVKEASLPEHPLRSVLPMVVGDGYLVAAVRLARHVVPSRHYLLLLHYRSYHQLVPSVSAPR